MAYRPTETKAYEAGNMALPLYKAPTYANLSGDGLMDPPGSLGLRDWSNAAPHGQQQQHLHSFYTKYAFKKLLRMSTGAAADASVGRRWLKP